MGGEGDLGTSSTPTMTTAASLSNIVTGSAHSTRGRGGRPARGGGKQSPRSKKRERGQLEGGGSQKGTKEEMEERQRKREREDVSYQDFTSDSLGLQQLAQLPLAQQLQQQHTQPSQQRQHTPPPQQHTQPPPAALQLDVNNVFDHMEEMNRPTSSSFPATESSDAAESTFSGEDGLEELWWEHLLRK